MVSSRTKQTVLVVALFLLLPLLIAAALPVPDIIVKGKPWYDVRAYTNWATAVSSIGATESTIYVLRTETISANSTPPATMDIHVLGGGSFSVSAGKVLNLSNCTLTAATRQIFSGAGTIVPPRNSAKLEWFGTLATASSMLSTNPAILTVESNIAVTSTTSMASTIGWDLQSNGRFTVSAAQILTLSGPFSAPPGKQVFFGDGAVIPSAMQPLDSDWWPSFARAVTDIGTNARELVVRSAETISENLTVPTSGTALRLRVESTGSLNPAAATTTTVNVCVDAASSQDITGGAGTITYAKCLTECVSSEAQLTAALANTEQKEVRVCSGSAIDLTAPLTIPQGMHVDFEVGSYLNVGASGSLTIDGTYDSHGKYVIRIPDNTVTVTNRWSADTWLRAPSIKLPPQPKVVFDPQYDWGSTSGGYVTTHGTGSRGWLQEDGIPFFYLEFKGMIGRVDIRLQDADSVTQYTHVAYPFGQGVNFQSAWVEAYQSDDVTKKLILILPTGANMLLSENGGQAKVEVVINSNVAYRVGDFDLLALKHGFMNQRHVRLDPADIRLGRRTITFRNNYDAVGGNTEFWLVADDPVSGMMPWIQRYQDFVDNVQISMPVKQFIDSDASINSTNDWKYVELVNAVAKSGMRLIVNLNHPYPDNYLDAYFYTGDDISSAAARTDAELRYAEFAKFFAGHPAIALYETFNEVNIPKVSTPTNADLIDFMTRVKDAIKDNCNVPVGYSVSGADVGRMLLAYSMGYDVVDKHEYTGSYSATKFFPVGPTLITTECDTTTNLGYAQQLASSYGVWWAFDAAEFADYDADTHALFRVDANANHVSAILEPAGPVYAAAGSPPSTSYTFWPGLASVVNYKAPHGGIQGWVRTSSDTWSQVRPAAVRGEYDFAVSGGAQGAFVLGTVPDNATITRAWYEVITPFTSGGAATVALGVATNDATGVFPATAYNDAAFNAGYHDATPDGTATNFTTKSTAQRSVILTVGGADLTAGNIHVYWEYVVSE